MNVLTEHESEALRAYKEEFITDMSHNLRTPLACIKLSVVMLRNTEEEVGRNRYLDILEEECDKEIEFINELFSRYEP